MLMNYLEKSGHDVSKMNVPHIPIKNLKNPSFTFLSSLMGTLWRENYDIVHGFNIPSVFAMRRINSKKKVLSIHGVYSEQVEAIHSTTIGRLASSIESKVLTWPDKLITDSRKSQLEYKKKLHINFEYLPTPIDLEKFEKIPNVKKNPKQVIFIGRDSFEKGIDILKDIESQIDGNVIFCIQNSWKEAMMLLKSSSILVVPSRIESLPTIIKEAFFLKIPVVAFSVGGIPELIENGRTGLLVEPYNSKSLIETINYLLNDKILQKKLSDNAFEFVTHNLSLEIIFPKYLKFYESLFEK